MCLHRQECRDCSSSGLGADAWLLLLLRPRGFAARGRGRRAGRILRRRRVRRRGLRGWLRVFGVRAVGWAFRCCCCCCWICRGNRLSWARFSGWQCGCCCCWIGGRGEERVDIDSPTRWRVRSSFLLGGVLRSSRRGRGSARRGRWGIHHRRGRDGRRCGRAGGALLVEFG